MNTDNRKNGKDRINGLSFKGSMISPCIKLCNALVSPHPGHSKLKKYAKGHLQKNTPLKMRNAPIIPQITRITAFL